MSYSSRSTSAANVQLCRAPQNNKKRPVANWPPGALSSRKFAEPMSAKDELLTPEGFMPVQRIGPPPWIFWPVEPVAGPDEVVGGDEIVGGIGHDATPTLASRPPLHRSDQAQLQPVAAVISYHANAAEITRMVGMRRWHQPGESDRQPAIICKPPMAVVEFRNGRTFKKCQAVEVGERIGNFVVIAIDLAYPVHRFDLLLPSYRRPERVYECCQDDCGVG